MEQLNRVELRGTVGNTYFYDFGDRQVMRFSVVTNFAYKGRQGDVIEATWHNVTVWSSPRVQDVKSIAKGAKIHLVGRLKNDRYLNKEGQETTSYEIVADRFEIINPDETFVSEMN